MTEVSSQVQPSQIQQSIGEVVGGVACDVVSGFVAVVGSPLVVGVCLVVVSSDGDVVGSVGFAVVEDGVVVSSVGLIVGSVGFAVVEDGVGVSSVGLIVGSVGFAVVDDGVGVSSVGVIVGSVGFAVVEDGDGVVIGSVGDADVVWSDGVVVGSVGFGEVGAGVSWQRPGGAVSSFSQFSVSGLKINLIGSQSCSWRM